MEDVAEDMEAQANIAAAMVHKIEPIMHGNGPHVQGVVLADLTATWLAGFQGEGALEKREELLLAFLYTVRELIPINEIGVLKHYRDASN